MWLSLEVGCAALVVMFVLLCFLHAGLLFRTVGSSGIAPVLAYAGAAGLILALVSPKNSSMEEARLESQYRALQIRIKTNAESVAFLSGLSS